MYRGFIEYCPECHYHTEFHELSLLGAIHQVDDDWLELNGVYCRNSLNCPICGEELKDWYGPGEPFANGPYKQRIVSIKFLEVINETV